MYLFTVPAVAEHVVPRGQVGGHLDCIFNRVLVILMVKPRQWIREHLQDTHSQVGFTRHRTRREWASQAGSRVVTTRLRVGGDVRRDTRVLFGALARAGPIGRPCGCAAARALEGAVLPRRHDVVARDVVRLVGGDRVDHPAESALALTHHCRVDAHAVVGEDDRVLVRRGKLERSLLEASLSEWLTRGAQPKLVPTTLRPRVSIHATEG